MGGSSPWGGGGGNLQSDAAQLFLFVPIPAKAKKLGLLSIYKFSLGGKIAGLLRPRSFLNKLRNAKVRQSAEQMLCSQVRPIKQRLLEKKQRRQSPVIFLRSLKCCQLQHEVQSSPSHGSTNRCPPLLHTVHTHAN